MIARLKELWRWVWVTEPDRSEELTALQVQNGCLRMDVAALEREVETLEGARDSARATAIKAMAERDAALAEVETWRDRHRALRNYHQRGGKERRAARKAASA